MNITQANIYLSAPMPKTKTGEIDIDTLVSRLVAVNPNQVHLDIFTDFFQQAEIHKAFIKWFEIKCGVSIRIVKSPAETPTIDEGVFKGMKYLSYNLPFPNEGKAMHVIGFRDIFTPHIEDREKEEA